MAHDSSRVAFLGPEGTFTEEALLADPPAGELAPFPYPSIQEVMQAVATATPNSRSCPSRTRSRAP